MKDPYDHIDQYLANQLNDEDRRAFEEAMRQDTELFRLVEDHPLFERMVDAMLEHELEQEMEKFRVTGGRLRSIRTRWWLAAAVVGLVIGGWWIIRSLTAGQEKLTAEQVYDKFYEDPLWPATRGTAPETYEEKAYEAFINGNMESVRRLLLDSIENKQQGYYWLAEIFLKRIEPDSVLKYLTLSDARTRDPDRYVYLTVMSYLYFNDERASDIYDSLGPLNQNGLDRYLKTQ